MHGHAGSDVDLITTNLMGAGYDDHKEWPSTRNRTVSTVAATQILCFPYIGACAREGVIANNKCLARNVKKQCKGAQMYRTLNMQRRQKDVVKHELLTVSTLRSVSVYPSVWKPPIRTVLLRSLPILRSCSQRISRRRGSICS